MPARTTLEARSHKKSTDTVDRALAELVKLGAVQVQHRWVGWQRLTNRYRIHTSDDPATTTPAPLGIDAAALEAKLDALDGQRLQLQQQAREQLTAEGRPITRFTVLRRAVELLHS